MSVEETEIEIEMLNNVVAVPGSPPTNLRARPVSASTVVVQWEEPLLPNGAIKVSVTASSIVNVSHSY